MRIQHERGHVNTKIREAAFRARGGLCIARGVVLPHDLRVADFMDSPACKSEGVMHGFTLCRHGRRIGRLIECISLAQSAADGNSHFAASHHFLASIQDNEMARARRDADLVTGSNFGQFITPKHLKHLVAPRGAVAVTPLRDLDGSRIGINRPRLGIAAYLGNKFLSLGLWLMVEGAAFPLLYNHFKFLVPLRSQRYNHARSHGQKGAYLMFKAIHYIDAALNFSSNDLVVANSCHIKASLRVSQRQFMNDPSARMEFSEFIGHQHTHTQFFITSVLALRSHALTLPHDFPGLEHHENTT